MKGLPDVILLLKSILKDCYPTMCDTCQNSIEDAVYILKEIHEKNSYVYPTLNPLGTFDFPPEGANKNDTYMQTDKWGPDRKFLFNGTEWLEIALFLSGTGR